jgi:hypothetical protein
MTWSRTSRWWRLWAALSLALTVASACAARTVKIDHDSLSALKDGPPLKLARSKPPGFLVSDPGNSVVDSVFGVSGGTLTMPGRGAASAPMDQEFALGDPAIAVGDEVFEALAFELGVKRDQSDWRLLTDDRLESVTRAAGPDGWLLEVTTLRWGLAYDPRFAMRYRVQLQASGRLIDLSSQRVAWRATCDGSEGDSSKGLLLTELTASDGAELRERLGVAAERCAAELVSHLFAGVR